VPNRSPFEFEIANAKLERYESPGNNEIPAELIQVGGEILRSEIHKLISSIWNKEELPIREGIYYCTNLQGGR
jgi:hypothetical protein